MDRVDRIVKLVWISGLAMLKEIMWWIVMKIMVRHSDVATRSGLWVWREPVKGGSGGGTGGCVWVISRWVVGWAEMVSCGVVSGWSSGGGGGGGGVWPPKHGKVGATSHSRGKVVDA